MIRFRPRNLLVIRRSCRIINRCYSTKIRFRILSYAYADVLHIKKRYALCMLRDIARGICGRKAELLRKQSSDVDEVSARFEDRSVNREYFAIISSASGLSYLRNSVNDWSEGTYTYKYLYWRRYLSCNVAHDMLAIEVFARKLRRERQTEGTRKRRKSQGIYQTFVVLLFFRNHTYCVIFK